MIISIRHEPTIQTPSSEPAPIRGLPNDSCSFRKVPTAGLEVLAVWHVSRVHAACFQESLQRVSGLSAIDFWNWFIRRDAPDFNPTCNGFWGLHAVVFRVVRISQMKVGYLVKECRVPEEIFEVGLEASCAEKGVFRGFAESMENE